MRKEMKLGLGIGGVLLILLLAYIIAVSSPNPAGDEVALETEPPAANSNGDLASSSLTVGSRDGSGEPQNDPADVDLGGGTDPDDGGDVWASALTTGEVPLMLSETPRSDDQNTPTPDLPANSGSNNGSPSGSTSQDRFPRMDDPADDPGSAQGGGDTSENNSPQLPPGGLYIGSNNLTAPAGGASEYIVEPGDTLEGIAKSQYGDGRLWRKIVDANNGLDPRRLRVGMKLKLPDPSSIRSGGSPSSASSGSTPGGQPVDASREYRVQPNDSLYVISQKLYGRDRVKEIHELNRQLIGPNPDRVRVGMVLKLPEPPTRSN